MDFLEFVSFVKRKSVELKNCYFSGDLNCLTISKEQFSFSIIFKSDFSISILIENNERIILENCSVEKMKKFFNIIFED